MSAIGDYVHYYAKNYNRFGTNMYGEGAYEAYNFQAQKDHIKERIESDHSKMTPQEMADMQESLSYIFSNSTGDTWNNNVVMVQDAIAQQLQSEFGDRLGTIDFSTGNITSNYTAAKRDGALTRIKTSASQKNMYLKTITDRITQIENMSKNIKSPTQKTTIQNSINAIKQSLATLCQTAEEDLQELSAVKMSLEYDMQTETLVQDLNKIIHTLQAAAPINLEKGDLLEYTIALCQGVAQGITADSVETALKQVVGGNRTNAVINLDQFFTDKFNPSDAGLTTSLDDYGNTVAISSSQQKVDVEFNLGDGRTANISAKNVNLNSGYNVHIVSSTPLSYLIQDESPDFANHYLNLCAAHPDEENINLSQLMAAHEAMKMTAIWKALSGETYGRNNSIADTFIINDNSSTGRSSIKVYDIASLAEKIMTNIDTYATVTSGSGDLNTIAFRNNWSSSSYAERISNLLADVHAQKITVTLSPSVFT